MTVHNLETEGGVYVAGGVLVHNCHLAAASTFSSVVDQFPARYRIGVSDDERRKDRKEFLIYDLFGERIAETDRDELVDQGVIFDVEIRLIPTNFQRDWWDETPEPARPTVFDRLLFELTQDEERNRLLLEVARAETKRGEKVLFFSHRVEHCENLRALFAAHDPRVGLMTGGKPNEAEFSRSIAGLLDGSVVAGFGTYQALGASIDLPNVGRGIACTPIHNNRQFVNQVRGRVCRRPEGKVDAVLFYPFDVRVFGLAPAVNLARIAKVAKVLEGGQWVDAKGWIKKARREREEEEEDLT